jgi:hypothetical protein
MPDMQSKELLAAIIAGAVGITLFWLARKHRNAETEKFKAETDKNRAETAKILADTAKTPNTEKSRDGAYSTVKRKNVGKLDWIVTLNSLYPQEAEIIKVLEQEPILHFVGKHELTDAQREISELFKEELTVNDPHALCDEISIQNESMEINYKVLWYHEVIVLRMAYFKNDEYKRLNDEFPRIEDYLVDKSHKSIVYKTAEGIYVDINRLSEEISRAIHLQTAYKEIESRKGKPPILSANAVIVCEERREIYFHDRSWKSRTHPGYYHTMGGGYAPPELGHRIHDGHSLINTAHREIKEETLVPDMAWNPNNPLIWMEEKSTGFLQLVLMGTTLPAATVRKQITRNWKDAPIDQEGKPRRARFDDLEDILTDPEVKWVPTGKLHILSWLALGTPGCNNKPTFNGKSSDELYGDILRKNSKY